MAEQRYRAVLAVISDGETVTEVAARFGVARKTVHDWLAKYEAGGLDNLGDRSHRPWSCPHQMGSLVEVEIARIRAAHPWWGPRRLVHELAKQDLVISESAVYRALVRLNLIPAEARRHRNRKWKRWERDAPMELWQMDVVGGFVLADERRVKALTGLDDHSRFCVSAHLMLRETSGRCVRGSPRRCGPTGCQPRWGYTVVGCSRSASVGDGRAAAADTDCEQPGQVGRTPADRKVCTGGAV